MDWRKLKFPDENASANELHTILSDFLREGLDAADGEEQKRLQLILKRLELNRRNHCATRLGWKLGAINSTQFSGFYDERDNTNSRLSQSRPILTETNSCVPSSPQRGIFY